jgi:long-chain acyl-CoA synthetase
VPGVELEIRGQDASGVGEVWVRGRTVMQGYLNNPEATREALVDGWFRTGDLGSVDVSGHLKLVGRSKNMIVTDGGKNIYPEDIEAVFESVPCEELCVFAERYVWKKRELREEGLCVVLRLKPDVSLEQTLAAVQTANRKLADFKRVSSYAVVSGEFPRTASMKIKRIELANSVQAALTSPTPLPQT